MSFSIRNTFQQASSPKAAFASRNRVDLLSFITSDQKLSSLPVSGLDEKHSGTGNSTTSGMVGNPSVIRNGGLSMSSTLPSGNQQPRTGGLSISNWHGAMSDHL